MPIADPRTHPSRTAGARTGDRMPSRLAAVVVSTFALASAYMLTAAVHELAHALAAAGFGLDPVWHGDRVAHAAGTAGQEIAIGLAGPVYSAVSGVLALMIASRTRGYLGLLLSWLGLLSVAGVCGYLTSAAFATDGDVSDVLHAAQAPPWAGWVGLVLGVAGLLAVTREASARIVAFAPPGWSYRAALLGFGLVPLVVAVPLLLASGVPIGPPLVAQLAILLVTVLLALVRREPPAPVAGPRLTVPTSVVAAMVVLVALGLVQWLALRPGLAL